MANILHWTGVVMGFSVIAIGIHFFLRGLSLKPGEASKRGPGKGRGWKT
jgi:hypothetical protein